jgi:signal transduction histidine kinase
MNNPQHTTSALGRNELAAVYAISRVAASTYDVDEALDQIINLSRSVFIFDNAIIYWAEKAPSVEPMFARAIGRGRSSEDLMPWGEFAAEKVITSGENFSYESKPPDGNDDRMEHQYYLGLPMLVSGKLSGAVVFIRFGGPEFSPEQERLAEYITNHITQIFEYQRLVDRVANLEAERRLVRLQEDFMAMVSHELNTPLGFIKGYTTTLLRKEEWDHETLREFLKIIDEESDRLAELIENLLDSSRLQSGMLRLSLRESNVNGLISNILQRVRTRYNNLTFNVQLADEDVKINADPKRISQVLENLIGNAAKYAPRSTVTISAKAVDQNVVIAVADDGPGIPSDHLENIFKRFYRVPERSAGVRGTGLGLFIVEQIVVEHGGEIRVDSKLGKGTTFEIVLPALKD